MEIVFTALLVFVVLATTTVGYPTGFGGLAAGLTLGMIHLATIPVDNTSVNPARSFGAAIFSGCGRAEQLWAFFVFPLDRRCRRVRRVARRSIRRSASGVLIRTANRRPAREPVGMTDDLAVLDATAQAELVARGEVTARELVEAAIERIERLEPALNAVIHERFERAPDEADARRRALPDGPFHGVPFLVKDAVCHTAGDPFHCGMRALKDAGWTEPDDTWLAARFRAAGFVFVGKTNTPELATSCTTEPLAYGATHNPWDLDAQHRWVERRIGGRGRRRDSSPVAHGNDMGGSIRFPASMCGIVGLKPTRARTTLGPDFGEYWGPLTHEFVLTRTGARHRGRARRGRGRRHRRSVHRAAAHAAVPRRSRCARRAVADRVPHAPARRRRRASGLRRPRSKTTAQLLEELGHDVAADRDPRLDAPIDHAFGIVMTRRDRARHRPLVGAARPRHHRRARTDERDDRGLGGAYHRGAVRRRPRRHVDVVARGVGLLGRRRRPRAPDESRAADRARRDRARPCREPRLMADLVSFTSPFDLTGQPAISLPLHWNADGLPIGVQLVAALRPRGRAVAPGRAARDRRVRGPTDIRRCSPEPDTRRVLS